MASINWTKQAKDDLIHIAEYIRIDSEKYAKITVFRIREKVNQLATFPYSGNIVPEISVKEIREIHCGNYRIIYIIKPDHKIDILTIHHAARKLRNNNE